jgi:hypothetical protein
MCLIETGPTQVGGGTSVAEGKSATIAKVVLSSDAQAETARQFFQFF